MEELANGWLWLARSRALHSAGSVPAFPFRTAVGRTRYASTCGRSMRRGVMEVSVCWWLLGSSQVSLSLVLSRPQSTMSHPTPPQ